MSATVSRARSIPSNSSVACVSPPSECEVKEHGLARFFVKKTDFIHKEAMSFQWPMYFGPLKRSQPDVAELVRTSCKRLTKDSKYVSINHDILGEVAKRFGTELKEMTHYESPFKWHLLSNITERDSINMICLFVILQFGSGFTSMLQKYCEGQSIDTIATGITNMHKKYSSLDVNTLRQLSIDDVGNFFQINCKSSPLLESLCDMIRKCIVKIVNILDLKHFTDFADYIYHYIDLAWIKSQTKDLSAIKTIEWELNNENDIGLVLAPTQSNVVRRCVVIGFKPTMNSENSAKYDSVCQDLVRNKAFLYAINDQVIYNKPFAEVIRIIKQHLNINKKKKDDEINGIYNECRAYHDEKGKHFVALQFGMHLDREPDTMQTLLFSFINDFSVLNDQYLYKSFYGANKHIKVYLFQSVQSIVMELYYNLYKMRDAKDRNPIFNFKGINSLTAVVDNVIPFVLLQHNVICIKDKFKSEFNECIDDERILKTSDLEIEIIASAVWALELLMSLMKQQKNSNCNIAELVYLLRNRGRSGDYRRYTSYHSRRSRKKST